MYTGVKRAEAPMTQISFFSWWLTIVALQTYLTYINPQIWMLNSLVLAMAEGNCIFSAKMMTITAVTCRSTSYWLKQVPLSVYGTNTMTFGQWTKIVWENSDCLPDSFPQIPQWGHWCPQVILCQHQHLSWGGSFEEQRLRKLATDATHPLMRGETC